MLDVYHMSYEDESISLGLVKAKNRLLHLHFADSNRGAPGQGKFNFEDIMKTLHSIQYNGYLSMEVSYEIDRYDEAKEAVDYLSPWMKEE
jgi:sugar phosphate isomerase/epimerase